MVEHLWAGWRIPSMLADRDAAMSSDSTDGATLFEAILAADEPDAVTHVIVRRHLVFALLNRYPYSTGHVLVVPVRPVADLEDLDDHERHALWDMVHEAVVAVRAAFHPDGVNVGVNLGEGAGPSVPDHVHIHVVPRWKADTNFMTAVADVRVMPQTLDHCWERLVEVWPTP